MNRILKNDRTLPIKWFDLITTQEEIWYRHPELRPDGWDAEEWIRTIPHTTLAVKLQDE